MLGKYRHMSFGRERYVPNKKFEALTRAKSLRTFVATSVGVLEEWHCFYLSDKVLVDLSHELSVLRVLSLSNFQITEVPDTIGTLRHLRYINFPRTRITNLPEDVCNLYNLETLILFGCEKLTELPNNFFKLKNLRHLDIRDTPSLSQMPLGVGELKNLQTLSKIFIGDESRFKIAKHKEFKNLCGKVSILGLDKVENAVHACEANFSQKSISELELVWSDEPYGSRNKVLEKEALNELTPCNDKLIQLKITSYMGSDFPKWVGDPSFHQLKHVSLRNCKRCTSLPPLAQVHSLKELFMEGLDGVKVVGMELLGSVHAFPSLEVLKFRRMRGWEKWSINSEAVFPRLKQLYIEDCPNLVEVELKALPLLNALEIGRCDSGVLRKLVEIASAVNKLLIKGISGLNDVVWRGVTGYLRAVEDLSIYDCNEIEYLWESEATASNVVVKLRKLQVYKCDNLLRLGEKEEKCRSNLLTSLRKLTVMSCNNMESCSCPESVEELTVWDCSSITTISLPMKLKSVEIYSCKKLLEREWGGEERPMLEHVRIREWINLRAIIELNCFVRLTQLLIRDCECLESFPDYELPNLTALVIINCPKVDVYGVWPPNLRYLAIGKLKKPVSEWGPQNFPASLDVICLDLGDCSSEFSPHLLFSSLTDVQIAGIEKFESFTMGVLQHLTSLQSLSFSDCFNMKNLSSSSHPQHLQHLSFYNCPEVIHIPEQLLHSLLSLEVSDCPNLKERYSKGGSSWRLISHIPCILLD